MEGKQYPLCDGLCSNPCRNGLHRPILSEYKLWIELNCEGEGPHVHFCETCDKTVDCRAVVYCDIPMDKPFHCTDCRAAKELAPVETAAQKKRRLKDEKRKKGQAYLDALKQKIEIKENPSS
jgi:hypothetical protein